MAEIIDITARKMAETDLAVLVTTGTSDDAAWLPKSQIEMENAETIGHVIVSVPEWLAMDKGLI